jgi:hypothetical protein
VDAAAYDSFGRRVALSADGGRALIGAKGSDPDGAAYVFISDGTAWTQESRLTPPDDGGARFFGTAVGLSGNGDSALVGAPGSYQDVGRAFVFVRVDSTWSLQALIPEPDSSPGHFGASVALSGEGNTALIGDGANGSSGVPVHAFSRSDSNWTHQATLEPFGTGSSGRLGISIALDDAGTTALVGAYSATFSALGQGAGYLYRREGSTWSDWTMLTASDPQPYAHLGYSVALDGGGGWAVLGATEAYDPINQPGSTYVFGLSEDDTDIDGILNPCDNCPIDPNPEQADCNGDGTGDACAISSGASLDCNSNGVPDECDAAVDTQVVYLVDDSSQETGLGLLGGSGMIWLNQFTAERDGEEIVAVDVAWGTVAEGTPTDIAVWSDPDGDGDPWDALLLMTSGPVPAANPDTDAFTTVQVPPTLVGNAGDGFFVGAHLSHGAGEYPAALDETPPSQGRSWVSGGSNLVDLPANGYVELVDDLGFPGNWLIRARRAAVPDCNDNGIPDECDIADATTPDANGNGVPDECETPGDVNGDGDVDVSDFLALLAAWGACPDPPASCPADFDGDGSVGVTDFLDMLANWS